MTDPIEPALTPEEWKNEGDPVVDGYIDWDTQIVDVRSRALDDKRFIPGLIALANAALPDDDPHKITREMVRLLRDTAEEYDYLTPIADALASYLPPEGP